MPPKKVNNDVHEEAILKLNNIIEKQNNIIFNLTNINLENNKIITNLNQTITNNLIELKNLINVNQIKTLENINNIEEKTNNNIKSYANITKKNIEKTYEINTNKIINNTLNKRNKLECNNNSIIIYNLTENKENNFNLRNKNTNSIINDITEILEIQDNIQIMDSYRIGKFNEQEINKRPLKIILNNTKDKSYFLRNAFKLKDTNYKHIGVVEEYNETDKLTLYKLKIEIKNKLKSDNTKKYCIKKINNEFKIIEINKNE